MRRFFWLLLMTFPLWGIAADSGESMLFGNDALGVMMYDSTYDISLKYMKMLFGSDIGINVSGFGNGYTGTLFRSIIAYTIMVIRIKITTVTSLIFAIADTLLNKSSITG